MLRKWELFGQRPSPQVKAPTGALGGIRLGQGPHYGLREMAQSLCNSLAHSAAAATSSSSPSSSVSVLI